MKKVLFLVSVIFLSGCMTVRTYTIEKPRVDTDLEGNRGYLAGTPKEEVKKSRLGDTRKVSILEIEFKPVKPMGYLGEYRVDKREPVGEKVLESARGEVIYAEENFVEPAPLDEKYYTVRENDTLQTISHKFYGTTRKWKFIYDNNKDVLKNPNKVYPGTRIKIPALD